MLLEELLPKRTYSTNLAFRIKFVWWFTAIVTCIAGGFIALLVQDWRFVLAIGGSGCLVGLVATVVEILL